MFPNNKDIENLRNSELYQKALEAFKSGDTKKGHELLNRLSNSSEFIPIKEHYEKNSNIINSELNSMGIINIDINDPIPEGYNHNSFTAKTCITTQKKDLPEWKDITAKVMYENKSVYEDHYTFRLTTMQALYDIKNKHPNSFKGIIKSSSSIENTLGKFMKNSLYLIIDELDIELSNVSYCVVDILEKLSDLEYLKEINISHIDRKYSNDEIKKLKQLSRKMKIYHLNLKYDGNNLDISL